MHERTDLCQRNQWLLASIVFILVCSFPFRLSAQTALKLVVEPDLKENTLYIPSDKSDDIKIYAEIIGKWKQLNWKFSGPGNFQNTGFGAVYLPPQELKESPASVLLAATLITNKGRLIRKELKWLLMNPPPTPTITPSPTSTPTITSTPTPRIIATASLTSEPTAIPTATPSPSPEPIAIPTVTPSPGPEPTAKPTAALSVVPKTTPDVEATPVPSLSDLEMHLRTAKRYFDQKSYTTPQGKNAFDEYKAVLTLDPTNRRAGQGIYSILRKYKFWGDDEYKKGNLGKSRKAYERYVIVAEYLVEIFQDKKLEQNVQAIKEKLQ